MSVSREGRPIRDAMAPASPPRAVVRLEGVPSPRRRIVVAVASLALPMLLFSAGCTRRTPAGCERGWSKERCAWVLAQRRSTEPGSGDGGDGQSVDGREPSREPGWSEAEDVIDAAVDHFAAGLPTTLANHEMLALCAEPPTEDALVGASAWACRLAAPPRLDGFEFTLELNEAGVIALHTSGLSGEESARLLTAARRRWSTWCDDRPSAAGPSAEGKTGDADARRRPSGFRPVEDTPPDVEFERCALPEGPTLLLGRFPENFEDIDSDVWHVSVSIMGPG